MIDKRIRPIFRSARIARAALDSGFGMNDAARKPRRASSPLGIRSLGTALWVIGQLACTSRDGSHLARPRDAHVASGVIAEAFRFDRWEQDTFSPRDVVVAASLQSLQTLCGPADAALRAVAQRLAMDDKFGYRPDDLDRLAFALRASGSPYVWPRAWSLTVPDNQPESNVLWSHFERWLYGVNEAGQRRCGVWSVKSQGVTTYAAVVSNVVADVTKPLPTRVRTGQWLDVQVQLLRDATEAKVILEGPRGEPVSVPASIIDNQVRARFPIAAPGPWLIQVLATMDTGPRPVVEVQVFADTEPPLQLESLPAPGESSRATVTDAAASLYAMLNAARFEEGRKALVRDARLDRLAYEHAAAMLAAGQIGHDVGDGSPKSRLENAGIFANLAGENVAHAADVVRTHRALWASPSHRSNILHRGFRNVGLAVIRAEDNTVWSCELFAALE